MSLFPLFPHSFVTLFFIAGLIHLSSLLSLGMPTSARRISNSRPRSKSSLSDTPAEPRPNTAENENIRSASPVLSISTPETTPTSLPPADTLYTPRKNGRRRYTPRQVPQYRTLQPTSSPTISPARSSPDLDMPQLNSLIQQLNGQMDGLVEYRVHGGPWER